MRTRVPLWTALAVFVACISCSTGPTPPAPGTPAFFWGAAKTTYHSGDIQKTSENLMQLVRTENEFTSRAVPLSTVISAGLAQGFFDLSQSYDTGARANRANPTPFVKQADLLRTLASASALEFAERVHLFLDKDKNPEVLLACEYPTGNMAEPPSLRKIAAGMLMQDSEKDLLQRAMIQRGVLHTMSQVLGTPDDAAKTMELLKTGEAKVPRATFVYGTAKALYDVSALYGPKRLDQPNRLQVVCQEAIEALQSIPETKETKALTAKIQASLKKGRISL
jgi:hypothetical protein